MSGGLRTADAVSESVSADQVLGSIVMFGVLYLLLFVLWIWVLDHKIQAGPAPVGPEPPATHGRDVLAAGARRVGHAETMTEAKQPAEAAAPAGAGGA